MAEEKKLIEFEKGDVDFSLDFVEGKVRLKLGYGTDAVDAGLFVDVDPDYFLDKLAAAIPGEFDDKIIALLKAAF